MSANPGLFRLDAFGIGLMEKARDALNNAVTLPPEEERHISEFAPSGDWCVHSVVGDDWVSDLFSAEEDYYASFPEGEFCPRVRLPHLELDGSGGRASHLTSLTEIVVDLRGFEVRFHSAPESMRGPDAQPVFVAGRAAYQEAWLNTEALERAIREYASGEYRFSAYRRWFQAVTTYLGREDLGVIAEEIFSRLERPIPTPTKTEEQGREGCHAPVGS